MNKFKEYWKNIDWGYTLLCIVAAPICFVITALLVATTTPELFDGWFK